MLDLVETQMAKLLVFSCEKLICRTVKLPLSYCFGLVLLTSKSKFFFFQVCQLKLSCTRSLEHSLHD